MINTVWIKYTQIKFSYLIFIISLFSAVSGFAADIERETEKVTYKPKKSQIMTVKAEEIEHGMKVALFDNTDYQWQYSAVSDLDHNIPDESSSMTSTSQDYLPENYINNVLDTTSDFLDQLDVEGTNASAPPRFDIEHDTDLIGSILSGISMPYYANVTQLFSAYDNRRQRFIALDEPMVSIDNADR